MVTDTRHRQSSLLGQKTGGVCPSCGDRGEVLHANISDDLYGFPGSWNVRRCNTRDCGCTWLDPRPLKEDLHKVYSNYYTHDKDLEELVGGARRKRRAIEIIEQVWLSLLGLRKQRHSIEHMFLNDTSPGKLLEVGCGDGALLKRMQALQWDVEGQDVDPNVAGLALEGVKVHCGELRKLSLSENSYDAIVSNHVIEHADDPAAFLADCLKLLRPGGVLVVTTPNPESYGHGVFGARWRGLEPPRHLHLLTPAALKEMAQRTGFSRAQVWTSVARAGGMLARSRDPARNVHHELQGRAKASHLLSAFWYQLTARLAHLRVPLSGEEAVLKAFK